MPVDEDIDSISATIARIDERLIHVQNMIERILRKYDEHERRIVLLEEWRNKIVGALAVLSFIVVALIGFMKCLIK